MGNILSIIGSAVAEEATDGDIFSSLGIDFQALILQLIAFVILVIILAKWIYPQVNAMLDRRDKVINDAIKAAKESEEKAVHAEKEAAKTLAQSRTEAGEIMESAKKESADMLTKSEFEAKKKADGIVRSAQDDIEREVQSAREQLRAETLNLVATATEKIVEVKLDGDDEKLVEKTLKGGR